MIDALTDPFSQGITQRALLELVILGAVCGPLGTWVVLYRQSYTAESMAHAMLPGLVLASLAGVSLVAGAAAGTLLAALGIWLAGRQRGLAPDTAVGVTITALFGLGALLALAPTAPARLGEILFGDLLAISDGDLVASAVLSAGVFAALLALHRPLALAAFDPATAPSLGARPATVELALLALIAVTVVGATQALGNLLVVALIVAPALAAARVSGRLGPALALSALLAIGAGVAGLYASYYLDLAAGASVALAAVAIFALAALPGPGSGRTGALGSPIEALRGGR
jgi:ABC-type Mn2+/Zn2+ transport system permease subunit